MKLPDPPASTNQVYAIMQKIKSFGSLSKSLTKLAKKKTPLPGVVKHSDASKQYENTQFYVSHDANANSTSRNNSTEEVSNDTAKSKSKLKLKNLITTKPKDDPYENTEFHSPPVAKFSPSKSPLPALPTTPLSNSSDGKISESKKNRKSGSSFRYNFRRSLGGDSNMNLGSSFNGKRSTFYVSNSIDVDSGVFTSPCEKTGDGPNAATSNFTNGTGGSTLVEDQPSHADRLSAEIIQKANSLRPNNPPPPPPPDRKCPHPKRLGASSWYAECGVFKANSMTNGDSSKYAHKQHRNGSGNSASWYAEAGLYQTSGASVASSSGSSGVSTGGEGGPGDDHSHSMFLNEPLYQIYSAAKLEVR